MIRNPTSFHLTDNYCLSIEESPCSLTAVINFYDFQDAQSVKLLKGYAKFSERQLFHSFTAGSMDFFSFVQDSENLEKIVRDKQITFKWKHLEDKAIQNEKMFEVTCRILLSEQKLSLEESAQFMNYKIKVETQYEQNNMTQNFVNLKIQNNTPSECELLKMEICSHSKEEQTNELKIEQDSFKNRNRKIKRLAKMKKTIRKNKITKIDKLIRKKYFKKQEYKEVTQFFGDLNQNKSENLVEYNYGSFFVGSLQNGLPNGHGFYRLIDGSMYKGKWINGKLEGYATGIDKFGNKLIGNYEDDIRHSFGVDQYKNGEMYSGYFKNNQKQGRGTYFFKDGSSYEGEWKEDMYEGKGIEEYSDGSVYVGSWIQDNKHGVGILRLKNGKKIEQTWQMGILIKETAIIE